MSARDELFRRVAGAFIDEEKADALLDAYRDEVLANARPALETASMQEAADWLMSQGHTIAARALDSFIDGETQPGIPRSRDRKVGYIVAQLVSGRLMVEAFRDVDGEWACSHRMAAATAKELADEFFEALMSLGGESRG